MKLVSILNEELVFTNVKGVSRSGIYTDMLRTGVEEECRWARHVIGSDIEGLNIDMVVDYIRYLGNKRARDLQLGDLFEDNREEPQSMQWVSVYSNANLIKTDFFEARSTAYAKSSALIDDLDD